MPWARFLARSVVVRSASDPAVRPPRVATASPVVSTGHPSTVTVVRLIEVLQRIIWIDLLNNVGLFTLRLVRDPLRSARDFGPRGRLWLRLRQSSLLLRCRCPKLPD